MTKWVVSGKGHDIHVVPTEDFREHECHRQCWCKPTENEEAANVVVHHSMDRREEYEEGRLMS